MSESDTLTIRPCRADDLPAVIAMLADDVLGAARETAGGAAAAYERAFEAITAQSGNTVYVAEEKGRVIGCFQLTMIPNLTFEGGLRAQIEGVRVSARARGQGVGEKMMAYAIQAARDAGCRIVQLTSNRQREDALRFYERMGFAPTHVGFKLYL